MDTNVLEQRSQFVRDFASGHWSMSELCERYGVTRPTGYKLDHPSSRERRRGADESESSPASVPASDERGS